MYARRFVPMLLLAGAMMMFMKHNRHEWMGRCEEGEKRGPFGFHGGFSGDSLGGPHSGPRGGLHGEWGKRVPPFFEKWHQQMHEQEAQPTTSAPTI